MIDRKVLEDYCRNKSLVKIFTKNSYFFGFIKEVNQNSVKIINDKTNYSASLDLDAIIEKLNLG